MPYIKMCIRDSQKAIISDYVATYFPQAKLSLYEDRDRSGYTFEQREGYQQMRPKLFSGESQILIIKDFSRFSRRNSLGLLELETLRDAGVRIISINDGIDYPTKDDWMLIQFKFLMNEMPVTATSKKITAIIQHRQQNGDCLLYTSAARTPRRSTPTPLPPHCVLRRA